MFTIATYNVLAQSYIKPDRYPYSDPADLKAVNRLPRVERTIRELGADILCVQEVEPSFYRTLQDHLSSTHDSIFAAHPKRPDGAAIFYAKTMTAHQSGTFFAEGINVPFVELQTPDGPMMVTSLHLKWQRNDTPTSEHLGRRQLLHVISTLKKKTEHPIFLAGDFNAISQSCVIQAAQREGFHINCRAQRPWDTTNINHKRRKLDYILSNTHKWTPKPCRLPRLEKTTPMPSPTHGSDHLALSISMT